MSIAYLDNPRRFASQLEGIAALADTNKGLPVLNAVHLRVTGGSVYLTATDRFVVGIDRQPLAGGADQPDDAAILIALADVKMIAGLLKADRSGQRSAYGLDIDTEARTLTVLHYGQPKLTVRAVDGEFPRLAQLVAGFVDQIRPDETAPAASGVTHSAWVKVLKACKAGRKDPAVWVHRSKGDALVVTVQDSDPSDLVVVIMGRRSESGLENLPTTAHDLNR